MKTIRLKDREEWRAWLSLHCDTEPEIWLVYFKDGTAGVDYESSAEEALCFGWVDSIIKKIDEVSYARKFTPRKTDSKWSPTNIARVEKSIRERRMTPRGMALVEFAKKSGAWDNPTSKPVFDLTMPAEFMQALEANPAAHEAFKHLRASHQKEYLLWIVTAKRPETRDKRIAEAVHLLQDGKQLGLR